MEKNVQVGKLIFFEEETKNWEYKNKTFFFGPPKKGLINFFDKLRLFTVLSFGVVTFGCRILFTNVDENT